MTHRKIVPPPSPARQPGAATLPKASPAAALSDEELRDNILKCLNAGTFDPSDVSVHVDNGAVSLRCRVDNEDVRALVLDVVGGCGGAQVVACDLEIGPR
jgi:osmotically-inducible protein OsmY